MISRPTLVSAATVARLKDGSVLHVRVPYLVTPSAAELALKKRITIRVADLATTGERRAADAEPTADAPQNGELASRIEATLLSAGATPPDVRALCTESAALGCYGVCVNPVYVPVATAALAGDATAVITVCGFPLGANTSCTKVAEARTAQSQGAHEIDMVLPVGLIKAGDFAAVRDDIRAVRDALSGTDTILKVIIETPLLTDEEKVAACVIAVEARADFVKTGTGQAGPVTEHDVRLVRRTVGSRARIKAAGGIRDRAAALALMAAGADRLGTSKAADVLR